MTPPALARLAPLRRLLSRAALAVAPLLAACAHEDPPFPRTPYAAFIPPDDPSHIDHVACSLQIGDQRMTLAEAMTRYRVPGVSAAAMVDGRIVWAHAWGVADAASRRAMTPETILQAASVSKPMTAVAVMRMVQNGELSLDQDVGEYVDWQGKLGRRRARVTLRQLMSHSAGVNIHGFKGYPRSQKELPSTEDILAGKGTNSPAVRLMKEPGAEYKYSGGGFIVVQDVVEEEIEKPFSAAMYEWLIRPFRLTHSTYELPLSDDHLAFAANGYESGAPVPGGFHLYPESAPAGLWTTPTDLLTVASWLVAAYRGQPAPISQASVQAMLTPTSPDGSFGIGWGVKKASGDVVEAHHSGSNEGFTSVVVWRTDGRGAAVMVNSNGPIAQALAQAIGEEYGWRPKAASVTCR